MPTDVTDVPTTEPAPGYPPTALGGAGQADDRFRRLHKMSTTAGVGAGDYVAINGAAIAAVLLGVATATVLFGIAYLLLIPLAALVCAALAWVQVGSSNGTQTGRGLAALGAVLALGLGGYEGSLLGVAAVHAAAARGEVKALIHDFGQDVAAQRYEAAYQRCDAAFQQLVPRPTFEGTWRAAHNSRVLGTLTGIEWNGQLQFDSDPTNGQQIGGGMVLVEFDNNKESARTDMFFRLVDGHWKIDRIPQLFAPPGAAQPGMSRQSGRPSPTATPQPMGPPKPQ